VLRKIIIFSLVAVFLITNGAACSCSPNAQQVKQKITLTMWGVFDDETVFKPMIDLYQSLNPNVTINYVKKDYNEYIQQSVDAIAAGKGPDIWMLRNDWVFEQSDKLKTMTPGLFKKSDQDTRTDIQIYKDMFPNIAVQDNIINDQIYGIPLSIDTLAVYYNKQHFNEVQNNLYSQNKSSDALLFNYSPNTWEDFMKMSQMLTKKDANGNITRSGAALGTASNISNASDIAAALMIQNNTEMTSADRLTATFNLPISKQTGELVYPGTEALKFYTSFSDQKFGNYMWNNSLENSILAFEKGTASMMISYGYTRKRLSQEAPQLQYGIGPFPQINGATTSSDFASYYSVTVTNNSKYPVSSWSFIKFLYENIDTYLSATQRPSPKRISDISIPLTKERSTLGGNPFSYQIMSAKYWYKGKYPIKVDNAFFQMIDNVSTKGEDSQKAIDAAAVIVTELYKLTNQNITSTPRPTSASPTPTK